MLSDKLGLILMVIVSLFFFFACSVQDAVEELQEEGFRLVSSVDRMVEHHSFVIDHHCANVLMFPASAREEIQESELVRSAKLILQVSVSHNFFTFVFE